MILIVYSSEASRQLAMTLMKDLPGSHILPQKAFTAENFQRSEGLVFVGALGICVRTVAPHVKNKKTDPAVVCVDSAGHHAIAVLSGHIGGANKLTRRVARILGAEPVITTQSDTEGLWSLDTLAQHFRWQEEHNGATMNEIISYFVACKPTRLKIDVRGDRGLNYLKRTRPDFVGDEGELSIAVSHLYSPYPADETSEMNLYFRPPVLHLGIGCNHNITPGDIPQRIIAELHTKNLSEKSVTTIDTIPQKADEPLVQAMLKAFPWATLQIHQPEDIKDIDVPNPSEYALKHVGVPSVSEACALTYGPLLVEKQKCQDYTFAVSISRQSQLGGHVEFIGAGPGDPDLVSVRGMRFLQQADLILYAGSLVPERLTHYAHEGCVVRSSADMNLEEQFALMKEYYDEDKLVVRLHTGDPCIYGAIQEQMALLDNAGMRYHITPGISAFQAAAAALESQFTIPEKVQTIILTRGEGRTPMPEREQLHKLAQSQSTMCIYLSAAIVDDVQKELLMAYPPETPVAACYKLTWPEQKIYKGKLKDLAKIVHENKLTLTTLLVVGEAIDNREGLSRLYADEFKHLFRQ